MFWRRSRLRPRRGEEPRRSPRNHGEARLRAWQAARDQGRRAQHRGLSRSCDNLDRPAQGDLDRRRAQRGRDRELVLEGPRARTIRSGSRIPAAASTIPISNFSKTTPAGPSATTPAIATRSSRSCSRAVDNGRSGEAPALGLGDRQEAAGRRCAADYLSRPTGNLHGAASQGLTVMVNSRTTAGAWKTSGSTANRNQAPDHDPVWR